MKRIFLFALMCVTLVSCENVEIYTPALQANVNNELYRSLDSRASENEDGTYLIQGVTQNETLTLKVRDLTVGNYNLGGTSQNYASFEDFSGNSFFTNPDGEGRVSISNFDREAKKVSGTFEFTAIQTGIDTLSIKKGVFFEVPVVAYVEPIFDPATNAGTFVSLIDGNPFNPFSVSAVNNGSLIVITGSTTNRSIIVSVPPDVMTGNAPLPAAGFKGMYFDGNTTEDAISGNITIIEHNPNANTIKGTFSFLTPSYSISIGQFNVVYEE